MKTTRTRAIVLRRTNYGEADRVLHLLTPGGRLNVIAKGVRREKSKLAGGIELFAVCDVVAGQGKSDLGILTSARLVHFYRHILQDYDRMQFAYEMLTQVSRASESLDEPEWYDIAVEVLAGLDTASVALDLTKLWFYVRLSAMLGYELNTQRDYQGDKLAPDTVYRYDIGEKGLMPAPNGDVTADHIKVLRLVASQPLGVVAQVGGIGQLLGECLYLAREHAGV